jgi:hypothetical protein
LEQDLAPTEEFEMSTQQKRKTPLSQLIASVTESDADFQKAITTRTYRAGEVIATPEDLSDKLFILMNGKAQLVCQNKEGRRMMMSRVGPVRFWRRGDDHP